MDTKYPVLSYFLIVLLLASCRQKPTTKGEKPTVPKNLIYSSDILNYKGTPKSFDDRDMLMFSDQGAWFAYSFPDSPGGIGGFAGPFLMTQKNGQWISKSLAEMEVSSEASEAPLIDWEKDLKSQNSFASHMEQIFENDSIRIRQELVFISGHTALQRTTITNIAKRGFAINSQFKGDLFEVGITAAKEDRGVKFNSVHSKAIGYLQVINEEGNVFVTDSSSYTIDNETGFLNPDDSKQYLMAQTFIFPEYSWEKEKAFLNNINFDSVLEVRKAEKENMLTALIQESRDVFKAPKYAEVLAKAQLTLQNNWRIPAGELKHQGVFPSYHYEWFHGFWSWDSWKHAVGLSGYDSKLAKDQIRAMFDFQSEDGFIVDCIYRDTTIEPHNYRDTKPPLAAWAVAKVLEKDMDMPFLKEMYPKLLKYHQWWYAKRDHDGDGLCEYGSTDGTVLAAKWESGMDNAIRFDDSEILKNSDGAYSLNQESVDLNAYLYAEKLYLANMAKTLGETETMQALTKEAAVLKDKLQTQFYDAEDGWFYDTNLEGTTFVKGAGSEGWTALWANAATQEQAATIRKKMMDPNKFYTRVPFQTMAKDHPKFDPMNGYWRGPNWLDQAYFGIKGLRNYGFDQEADKATIQLLEGAQGVLGKGASIRENYHPLSGEGLYAKNFSWSAAHLIMMLTKE
ncbi:putative isomerase [Arenibacter nanhaiticus]|uniref:Putative isomerase n=1 Tax=Arenibacter nanhaiticus TaxID=558155 RepID=A0A1M6IV92_9FLAO|nr:trehalase family glycosidase [Arenibacter nanhaiticus]SHJ38352.1 putative isomerase [Arenibacter nanhaiticus]